MLMPDKISSHSRFLKKTAQDMKQLYDEGEYSTYIGRYIQYRDHTAPELELIEKYYEARLRTDSADSIVDDALLAMNEGSGDYETHMYYLLSALIELGRYFEVIEFSDHLMGETIPQGFRIEVAALRHRAKKALDESRPEPSEPEVTPDDFRGMLQHEKLEALAKWTDEQNAKYTGLVRGLLPEAEDYQLITFMLLYLREAGDSTLVEFEKFGEKVELEPSGLGLLEETELSKVVLRGVLEEVEARMPEFHESARAMVMSHIIHCYPLTPDVNPDSLIDSYLLILHEMVNLEYERGSGADESALRWIRSMEESIAAGR